MRRPLCLLGLVYVSAVFIAISFLAGRTPTYETLDKEHVIVAGYVEGKEYRMSQERKVSVISLSEAVIIQENQVAILEQFLSDSEKISQNRLHNSWKKNRGNLSREDAGGIEGVLCYMQEGKQPQMGSLVLMQGKFRAFSHASNQGEFDAADYYRIMGKQGRVMECRFVAQSSAYDVFREKMWLLRDYLSLVVDACYDGEDASVMKAMLLGEKGTLDADIKELYRQTGIIHILAVSGLHLSIIGMGCHKLFKKARIPNVINIILTIGLMYCYGTMTGMGISMLRAYIMFGIHLGASLAGRTYDLLTAVTVAAFVALLRQPFYMWHSGFLFSFGAVCGIGLFLPAALENLLGHSKAERAFFSGALVSLSTMPVYLCFYYEFPPYSVFLNLIVIPCMALVLLCALFGMAAAVCFLPLGQILAEPVHICLAFYEKCCSVCLKLPGNRWITGCPKPWQVAAFFGILAVLVVCNNRLSKLHFWQGVLCALFVLSVRIPQGLQVTVVDVGQGDCIYLSDDRVNMLIDGGSSSKSDVASYQIVPFLKHRGVSQLDAVIVTHPDSDHISGICTMLEQTAGEEHIEIGALYLPDVGNAGRNEGYRELERLSTAADVPVYYIGSGECIWRGDIMLTCIHPEKGWNTQESNAYSTVMHLTYGGFTALFTGDLEGEGEQRVLRNIREARSQDLNFRDITLLKVAHHGSKNSTSEAFLKELNPKIALISAGRANRYGHPHKELMERLEKQGCMIYNTQESGAVTVRVRGKKVQVETFLE